MGSEPGLAGLSGGGGAGHYNLIITASRVMTSASLTRAEGWAADERLGAK